MRKTEGLKPERVFYYFEELTKIPRCSYDEQRVSDYLKSVGEGLGLQVIQDKALNIIIRKPGTKGYEDKPIVIIQGHMDMVCEKADDCDIDFSKDPIPFEIEGDFMVAKKTTLGADNGIAVAMGLAILESEDIPHPPIELLVTTNEESGMTGAKELDVNNLKGKILINIDSEEEGTLLVSCAGGTRLMVTAPLEWTEPKNKAYELRISGLKGGHSGMEIDKGRGNSNRLLARVLSGMQKLDYQLLHIEGGSKSNAIPRLSVAKITLDKDNLEKARELAKEYQEAFRNELATSDSGVQVTLEETEMTDKAIANGVRDRIISAMMLIPTGVQSMSQDIEGLVESSNNMGVVTTLHDRVTIENAIRSSVKTLKEYIAAQIGVLAESLSLQWETSGDYPAWEYRKDSYIRDVFIEAHREVAGKDPNVEAIHAGLECGLFDEVMDDVDMISLGPDMAGVHAPGEKLSISSTERTFKLLLEALKKIN
ncbi:aminoacyl-histidine dipeptidase [Gudongella sp. DL1XJH-153]|uniref:aminoacyl-histidine dipeptidase n=1 Tax=Gudongella sp. DL1XJH-153 TaxID=3409804 RepID=UPI003BB5703E